MAADVSVGMIVDMTGLGKDSSFTEKFSVATTPTALTYNYRTLAVADTAEALDLGDVATVEWVIIKAIGAIYVDTSYSVSFSNELVIPAGQVASFKPGGTVYVKNFTGAATPAYEYWACGTT